MAVADPDIELDTTDYGKKFEYVQDFRGPRVERSCTDVICLLIFIVVLGGWGCIGRYAYRHGDLSVYGVQIPLQSNSTSGPKDSEGLICGESIEVKNKPFLFYFDLGKCIDPNESIEKCQSPTVCVEKCPNIEMDFSPYDCEMTQAKPALTCNRLVNMNKITTCAEIQDQIDNERCILPFISKPIKNRCINKKTMSTFTGYIDERWLNNEQKKKLTTNQPQIAFELIQQKFNSTDTNQNKPVDWIDYIQSNIQNTWKPIVVLISLATLCCLIVIAMMRWLAVPLLWLSCIGIFLFLCFAIYTTAMELVYPNNAITTNTITKANTTNTANATNSAGNNNIETLITKEGWLYALLTMAIVALVSFLLVVLVMRKRIFTAIALVKEGSKAVTSMYWTLFFPIISLLLQVAVIGYAITVVLLIYSVDKTTHYEVNGLAIDSNCTCSASYVDGDSCTTKIFNDHCTNTQNESIFRGCDLASCKSVNKSAFSSVFYVINGLVLWWVLLFISAFGEMVLAGIFATWYWSSKTANRPFVTLTRSLVTTVRYHLGTLVFGCLTLFFCQILREILHYISKDLKKYQNNVIVRAIYRGLQCFFWCMDQFLPFLNKNSYIVCAIHGTNFCTSSKDAFNLLMRNFLRLYAMRNVTSFLLMLCKIWITFGMGAVTYLYLKEMHVNELNDLYVPTAVVVVGTYLISSVFFDVFYMAVQTLFVCFLEDSERNEGSAEKPYYMTKGLMRVLGEKNKVTGQIITMNKSKDLPKSADTIDTSLPGHDTIDSNNLPKSADNIDPIAPGT